MKKQSQRASQQVKMEQEGCSNSRVKEEYDSNHMQEEDYGKASISEEKGSSSLSQEIESQAQLKGKQTKKYGRNSKDPQNLKKIAFVLKQLLTVNQQLTIKNISFLLCEILSKPSFEHKMKTLGYHVKRQDINFLINERQQEKRNIPELDTGIVRNVRRRLYDAMNVMISAGLITKNQKKFAISIKGAKIEESFDELNYSELDFKVQREIENIKKTTAQIQSKENILKLKRQELKAAKLKHSFLENALKRKASSNKKPRNNKIFFPLLAVGCDPQMRIELSQSQIYMENNKNFEVYNEISLLNGLYDLGSILTPNIVKKEQRLN